MTDQVTIPTHATDSAVSATPAEQEAEVRAILAQAVVLERTKEFKLAHAQFNRARSLAKRYFGKHSRVYAESMHNLAMFNYSQDDFALARADAVKALEALDGCGSLAEMHDDPLWQNIVFLLQHL